MASRNDLSLSLSRAQVASLLRCDVKSVDEYVKRGMPSRKKGKERLFAPSDVVEWFTAFEREKLRKKMEAARPADFEKARAEKLTAEAEIKKLELAKLRGELVEVEAAARLQRADHERAAAVMRGGLTEFLGAGLSRELIERIAGKLQRAMVESADDVMHEDLAEDAAA